MYTIDINYQGKVTTRGVNLIPRVGDHIEITHIDQKLLSANSASFLIPNTLLVTKVVLIIDSDLNTLDATVFVEIPVTD